MHMEAAESLVAVVAGQVGRWEVVAAVAGQAGQKEVEVQVAALVAAEADASEVEG